MAHGVYSRDDVADDYVVLATRYRHRQQLVVSCDTLRHVTSRLVTSAKAQGTQRFATRSVARRCSIITLGGALVITQANRPFSSRRRRRRRSLFYLFRA